MVQALVKGLGLRGNVSSLPTNVSFDTVEINWANLQASAGAAIGGSGKNEIDAAIAAGDPFRTRILCGIHAPDWVRNSVGMVTLTNPQSGQSGPVPKWWLPAYLDLYEDFMIKFEAAYPDGTLRSIFEAGLMTIFAEPFIKGIRSGINPAQAQANCTVLWNAGYRFDDLSKPGDEKRAQDRVLSIMSGLWTNTRTIMSYSTMEHITSGTSATTDSAYTLARMRAWRAVLPSHVLQNNSIRDGYIANPNGPRPYKPKIQLFKDMIAVGKPLSFQTAARVGGTGSFGGFTSLKTTGDFAADMGAHALEAPGGAYSSSWGTITVSEAGVVDAELKANDSITPPAAVKLDIISVNNGVNPGVNVPFDVVVYAEDSFGIPANVAASTGVSLSIYAGSGSIGGTTTGTITSGSSVVTISGVTLNTQQVSMILQVARTSGDSLTSATSNTFNVDAIPAPPPDPDPTPTPDPNPIDLPGPTNPPVSENGITSVTFAPSGPILLNYLTAMSVNDDLINQIKIECRVRSVEADGRWYETPLNIFQHVPPRGDKKYGYFVNDIIFYGELTHVTPGADLQTSSDGFLDHFTKSFVFPIDTFHASFLPVVVLTQIDDIDMATTVVIENLTFAGFDYTVRGLRNIDLTRGMDYYLNVFALGVKGPNYSNYPVLYYPDIRPGA